MATAAAGLALVGVAAIPALAMWFVPSGQSFGYGRATTLPPVGKPGATVATGSATVSVTWPAASTASGAAVSGYVLSRLDPAGSASPVAGSCAGTVTATSCQDTGVPDGTWRYTVHAVLGASWRGPDSPSSNAATVATTPPAATVTFPANGQTYGVAGYSAGCGTPSTADMCGTASTGSVRVSLRRGSGAYWDPATGSFSSAGEKLFPVTSGTTAWSLAFPVANFPAAGGYTLRAVATDSVGRTGAASSTFTAYPAAPPAPVVSQPASPTSQTSTSVTLSDAQPGATFACSLDGGAFATCASPAQFGPSAAGTHTLAVQATDPGGNTGTATRVSWTVLFAALDVQATNRTGGTAGLLESGDVLTLSYNEPVAPGSVVAGWDGATAQAVTVEVDKTAANDKLVLTGTALGSIDLGQAGYLTANKMTFNASLAVSGSRIVITLTSNSNKSVKVATPGTMTWTPGPVKDTAGNDVSGTAVAETGTPDVDF
ncbi:MAG TPA: hypothetical protein VJT31_14270 [Rugosimonospora sp.]|nr:hypothetical protein [Rugosimonospora sp.]